MSTYQIPYIPHMLQHLKDKTSTNKIRKNSDRFVAAFRTPGKTGCLLSNKFVMFPADTRKHKCMLATKPFCTDHLVTVQVM